MYVNVELGHGLRIDADHEDIPLEGGLLVAADARQVRGRDGAVGPELAGQHFREVAGKAVRCEFG